MTTPDVNVHLIDFQMPGREMVVPNEDDSYTILINARLSQDEQLKAYQHALSHISNGDFEKSDIQNIEYQAHELETCEKAAPVPADKYEKRVQRLQREREKIQKALKDKEKEIALITSLYGAECFFKAAEHRLLYGGLE
nr:hypothetical protein [uncultured Acetatifactor sp.]